MVESRLCLLKKSLSFGVNDNFTIEVLLGYSPNPFLLNKPNLWANSRKTSSRSSSQLIRSSCLSVIKFYSTRPGGFEPPTRGLEIRCSSPLSYGRST